MKIEEGQKQLAKFRSLVPEPPNPKQLTEIVKDMSRPLALCDGKYKARASLVEMCDQMQVIFQPIKQNPHLAKTDSADLCAIIIGTRLATESRKFFGPKQGETVTVFKVRNDPSLGELDKLIDTLGSQTPSPLWKENPDPNLSARRRKEITNYSHSLIGASMAMLEVQKKAKNGLPANTAFDNAYQQATNAVYQLGTTISLTHRTDQPTNLEVAYASYKGQPNLPYARFGKNKTPHPFDTNRASKVYNYLQRHPSHAITEQIVESVVSHCLPKHLKKVKPIAEKIDDLPIKFLESISTHGVEQLYQKLPIPAWAKELASSDLEQLARQGKLKPLVKKIDKQMGKTIVTDLLDEFLDEDNDLCLMDEKTRPPLAKLLFSPKHKADVMTFLGQYQDKLKHLGLNKADIQTFKQWLENPHFFTRRMKWELQPPLQHFSWEKDTDITSVKQVAQYYQESPASLHREQARYQKAMLATTIGLARIIYGGWLKRKAFPESREASPSQIIDQLHLNCVGRSLLMTRVALEIGLTPKNIQIAFTYIHMALYIKFPEGKGQILETTAQKGHEFITARSITQKTKDLLKKSEKLVETTKKEGGERYLLVNIPKGISGAIINTYHPQTLQPQPLGLFPCKIGLGATEITNLFINIWHNKPGSKSKIDKLYPILLLQRMDLLCPEFCTPTGITQNGDQDLISSEPADYQKFIRSRFKKLRAKQC